MNSSRKIIKIAVILFLVLVLGLASALMIFLHSGKKDATFNESTNAGDISAASGLIAERSFRYQNKVEWTSEITFSENGYAVHTGSSLMPEDKEDSSRHVEFRCHYAILEDEEIVTEMEKKAKKDGESIYRCRDSLRYYEPEFSTAGELSDGTKNAIREYFRVPVSKDASISWGYDDEYDDTYFGTEGVTDFSLRMENLCGKEYMYLPYDETFEWLMGSLYEEIEAVNGYRDLLDESEIPGGYGLYELDGDEIFNVFTPDGSGRIEGICEADDSKLIITSCEDGIIYAYVFDAEKKETLQKIRIGGGMIKPEAQINDYAAQCSVLKKDGENIWIITSEKIVILAMKDGMYEKVINYDIGDDFDIYVSEDTAVAYDGEKAAVAGLSSKDREGALCSFGFSLAVIDQNGLLYSGDFRSGMDDAINEKRNISAYDDCFFDDFINLRWKENA